jgi:hypothetical protein
MKSGKILLIFATLFTLVAVSVEAATPFYEDFGDLARSEADGKVVPANGTAETSAANPGIWYKDAFGSFFSATNTTVTSNGNVPPADSTDGAAARIGYWSQAGSNYNRIITYNTGVNYDVNTNYTFTFSAKVREGSGDTSGDASAFGYVRMISGFWNAGTTNFQPIKSLSVTNLSATAWSTNTFSSNGARLSTEAYGQPIIIRFQKAGGTINSSNYYSWVDWVQIDTENPWADWVDSQGGLGGSYARTNDFDSDGIDDFTEWATGGDPTDDTDTGLSGSAYIADESGTNRFAYITPQQVDAWPNGVDYYLEMNDNLISGTWTNADSWVSGTAAADFNADFDAVTNYVGNVESNDTQFLRLRVSHKDYNP